MKHAREDYDRIQDPAGLIPVDEPVFLLRAQDPTAANAVRGWALTQCDRAIRDQALDHADRMDAWGVKKDADLPAAGTPIPCASTADTLRRRIAELESCLRELTAPVWRLVAAGLPGAPSAWPAAVEIENLNGDRRMFLRLDAAVPWLQREGREASQPAP